MNGDDYSMLMLKADYERRRKDDADTIKALKNEVNSLDEENDELKKDSLKYYDLYREQYDANVKLEEEVKRLSSEILLLRNENSRVHKLINEQKKSNAGRKKVLTSEVTQRVRKHLSEGHSQRETARLLGISLGLVNKAVKRGAEPQA